MQIIKHLALLYLLKEIKTHNKTWTQYMSMKNEYECFHGQSQFLVAEIIGDLKFRRVG